MNFRTTIILALVAAVAAVGIIMVVRTGETGRPAGPATFATARLFKDVHVEDISRIEIERRGKLGKVVLELQGGQWRLTAPVTGPADRYQAGDLAQQLAGLPDTEGDRLKLDAARIKEFDLEPPAALVRFTAAGKNYELAVGQETGLGMDKATIVRLPGAKQAIRAPGRLRSLVTDEVAAFRSKSLIDLAGREVVGLKLTHGQTAVVAERTDGKWTVTQPVRTRGEAEEFDKLVATAEALSAVSFAADNPTDLAPYGLDQPRAVVELLLKSKAQSAVNTVSPPMPETAAGAGSSAASATSVAGAQKPETAVGAASAAKPESIVITIGGYEDLQKTKSYAQVSGIPSVVVLAESKVRDLDKDLFALRDKSAVALDPTTVERVALDIDGSAVAIEKSGLDWQIVAPEKGPGDADEVSALVSRLAGLKVKKFVDHANLKDPVYGLEKPFGTIAFRARGGTTDAVVAIGKDKQSGEMWVADAGSTTVGRVDPAEVLPLRATWLDLLKRTIWKMDQPKEKVTEISWTRDGETVVLKSVGTEAAPEWKMVSPLEDDLDPAAAAKLVDTLSVIAAKKFVAAGDKGAVYGLDKPQIVLTVTAQPVGAGQAESPKTFKLAISEKDGKYYAQSMPTGPLLKPQAPGLIFEVDKALVEAIEKPLSKKPWLDFDAAHISRLELKGPQLDFVFNRSGEDWSVENAPDFQLNSLRVRWYLGDLAGLKAAQVARYAAKDLAPYGLDKPAWRIHLRGLTNELTVLVSDKGPGTGADRYATVEGSGRVVVLPAEEVTRLAKDKSYFRGTAD